VRGVAFFCHQALCHPHVARCPLEQTGRNFADFRLIKLNRRRLVVRRTGSIGALAHPGATVEHSARSLAGIHPFVLVEL
jgi:hypothetical protein